MIKRRNTLPVQVGNVTIGGTAPISVQTMSTVSPADTAKAIADAQRLAGFGAEIIRFAVPDMAAAKGLKDVVAASPVPIVADIHFDYRLALASVDSGVQALRINPGNIGGDDKVVQVVDKVRPKNIPIRIGINSGSLPADILAAYGGHPTAEGMVEGALRHIRILERMDYPNMVISLKSSQVPLMIEAYERLAEQVPYALHLGVTEAGLIREGSIKSAIGIGTLLYEGIGDTIRVSLTDDPAEEIKAGQTILSSLGLREFGPTLVSCPTCGRTQVQLISLAKQVEEALKEIQKPLHVAVMGCVVNGPGEAREADFGIAGGNGKGIVFSHGEVLRTVPEDQLVATLLEEIKKSL
ncbi:flavodoxin-dependent (E)-4-hydroxy-3-methylbut-2-enyl-diphosphate synthase [Megasphaera hominis]|jgi:(E)-4-hydroxy-3-methylbut-2-enyl-diphosphate synthase|uniref:4-hydroxy-3-methylbut-2-en-1-yl diphosphate synthase (flavodoxin) n=1 Tax=Megasphaera hominis TaxID=159836 RepID=A0ABR6VH94_9FIRM|nr:flavodoxin-dependent (E)-4-hydroxy-3-methylbut-2-enyl-diphosphate synthase [Megasphaera hominis]MBC3536518.1 flavodoxin-dependent (E)-4-hydroxy-3-methylbut-2-enyl-diphosphate synthase [Megasphaera hominis]